MHSKGSKKCIEMLEKTKVVDRIVFATGTPMTNSLVDLYVLQQYLQPHTLAFQGLQNLDAWLNTFARRESLLEVDVDTSSLRMITRYASFHNLTELMCMFASVCDFCEVEPDELGIPVFNGYRDIEVPRNKTQADYIHYLAKRTEDIRHRCTTREKDNMLKVTSDGRKCALDVRLVNLGEAELAYDAPESYSSKVHACCEQIVKLYHEYPATCQIVFADIGTPKSQFNVYDALRTELEEAGVPSSEIAYAHSAKTEIAQEKLYKQVNSGQIRVIIGSTKKLGVGVNLQKRLIALHHLDAPWRPADVEQREGRILRRGNTCEEVFIYRYVVPGTFDAYSWQILESKQRFCASFLAGMSGVRDIEDVSDSVLNYAEVKALCVGNPLIRKRVEKANEMDRARIANSQRKRQMAECRTVMEDAKAKVAKLQDLRKNILLDCEYYKKNKAGIPKDERVEFGEELLEAVRANHMTGQERLFDHYQGFQIILPAGMDEDKPYVNVRREPASTSYYVSMDTNKPMGCSMRIDHLLDMLQERASSIAEQIQEAKKQAELAEEDINKGNPYQKQVEDLAIELAEIDYELTMKEVM